MIFALFVCFAFAANLSNPSQAAQYNVYTPTAYKQINIVQSPKNAKINGTAVELLVDFSGSMIPWIQLSMETLEFILPKIPNSTSVALRIFGENPGTMQYTDSCKATRLVTYFKKDNQANILKGLQETQVGGNTPLTFALKETVEKDLRNLSVMNKDNNSKKNKKIILVTDGGDNCSGDPCEYIRELVRTRKDIQIDVIQLGSDNTLKCLTSSTGGSFYRVDASRKSFENALESVFDVPMGTVDDGRKKQNLPVKDHSETPPRGYKFINY